MFPVSLWSGRPVEGLTLLIERGRVVNVTAGIGQEAVEAELTGAPEESRAFREFALGFKPALKSLSNCLGFPITATVRVL